MLDSSDQASLEKICTGFDICIVGLVTGAMAVCERHCGRGVLMYDTDERARSDRRCLQRISIGGFGNPRIRIWGLGGAAARLRALSCLGWNGCAQRFGRGTRRRENSRD